MTRKALFVLFASLVVAASARAQDFGNVSIAPNGTPPPDLVGVSHGFVVAADTSSGIKINFEDSRLLPPQFCANNVPTCTTSAQCPTGNACINGQCECHTDADCPGSFCHYPSFCIPAEDLCTKNADCPTKRCILVDPSTGKKICEPAVNCTTNAQCPAGTSCVGGFCDYWFACTSAAQCPNGRQCWNGQCECTTNSECRTNGACGFVTNLLERNLYSDVYLYNDPVCTTWPLQPGATPAQSSLRIAIPDYNSHGKAALKSGTPSIFPRQAYQIDGGTVYKIDAISQQNLTGKVGTVQVLRGGIVTDKTGWRRAAPPSQCAANLDANTIYRQWDVLVTIDGTPYTLAYAVPDATGYYISPSEYIIIFTEFLHQAGLFQAFYWDFKVRRAGATTWERPPRQWKVLNYEGTGTNYGARLATYQGHRVIEVGNASAPPSYFPINQLFDFPQCGDGVVDATDGEQCDDGNLVDGDGCDSNCKPTGCGNGIITAGEQCDDGNTVAGDCCSPSCQFESASTVCRASAGVCDPAETCTGSSAVCPPDAKSTAVCRAAAGLCDVAESCNGVSNTCPSDGFKAAGTVCRASAGVCDVQETCSGSSAACPADGKSTAVCRASTGACDPAESCDGVSNTCPSDALAPAGTVCRPSAGVCDVEETCSGSSAACPADAKSTAVCRASTGVCDVAESCDGVHNTCPADAFVADGTSCDDGNACTSSDHCASGVCTGTCQVGAACPLCGGTCQVAGSTCSCGG
jgi:cysteine-rich repeat protein